MENAVKLRQQIDRLFWRAKWCLRRAGWPLVLAVILLLIAAGISCGIAEQKRHLRDFKMKQELQRKPPAVIVVDDSLPQRLAKFDDALPAHSAIPENIKKLLLLAEREQLDLLSGQYKIQTDPTGSYLRYQISLPVKGEYAVIQHFLLIALQEIPTLAIEGLSFKRETMEDSQVEARLQLVLFTRSKPGSLVLEPTQ